MLRSRSAGQGAAFAAQASGRRVAFGALPVAVEDQAESGVAAAAGQTRNKGARAKHGKSLRGTLSDGECGALGEGDIVMSCGSRDVGVPARQGPSDGLIFRTGAFCSSGGGRLL